MKSNRLPAALLSVVTACSLVCCRTPEQTSEPAGVVSELKAPVVPQNADGVPIKTTKGQLTIAALLYADDRSSYTDAVVLNPGGAIPAEAMSGLAKALAARGSIVYVVQYPNDLPIVAPDNAAELAKRLQKDYADISGLPDKVRVAHATKLKINAFGYSLGGAVLGPTIADEKSPFTAITLLGVSKFVKTPVKAAVKSTFILGESDGLTSRVNTQKLATSLKAELKMLPGVNHFCVISDVDVGDKEKREQDNATSLTSQQCISKIVDAMYGS